MLMDPVIIAVAPTGARRRKADHPNLPISPRELAAEAAACSRAGASLFHLHVRDGNGDHSLDAGRYRDALSAIEREIGEEMVVQVTTEAAGRFDTSQQIALLKELRPEAASVALREMVPGRAAETRATAFYHWAAETRIGLQHILYEPAEAVRLLDLQRRGVIPEVDAHPLFVLGRYVRDQQSDPAALLGFLQVWPRDRPWSVCAFGQAETATLATAIGLGGHVRVGFENNVMRPDGSVAASNNEAVARIAAVSELVGRRIAPVSQTRRMLGRV